MIQLKRIQAGRKKIMNKRKLVFIIILILLVSIIFLGVKYLELEKELSQTQALLAGETINQKIVKFAQLFVSQVLKAESEVSFETRLKLENAVRELNDQTILDQWQKFTNSKTETEAQKEVKNLLEILVNKITL